MLPGALHGKELPGALHTKVWRTTICGVTTQQSGLHDTWSTGQPISRSAGQKRSAVHNSGAQSVTQPQYTTALHTPLHNSSTQQQVTTAVHNPLHNNSENLRHTTTVQICGANVCAVHTVAEPSAPPHRARRGAAAAALAAALACPPPPAWRSRPRSLASSAFRVAVRDQEACTWWDGHGRKSVVGRS